MYLSTESRRVVLLLATALGTSAGSRCTFPQVWEGEYFHLGYSGSLIVSNHSISQKGECVWSSGSQYVLEGREEERGERCWRCLSIYRKHTNVLQYKESYCETYVESFDWLCLGIAGDSPMYSMIRRGGAPETCPFHGPHTFSYAKGGAGVQCSYPQSYMDSCSDRTQLQLSFQACADVQGTESSSEQLTCLADWKEGSKHYLVGELDREHVYSDEQRYRCFVYEYYGKGPVRSIRMAESMAATCKGLWSPLEGFRTFEIKKVGSAEPDCRYPDWFTRLKSWRSLSSDILVHVNSEHGFRLENLQDSVHPEKSYMSCHAVVGSDAVSTRTVSYVKSNCDSGFVCTELTSTSSNVVTARFGPKARNPSEACSNLYFSNSVTKTFLLVARRPEAGDCPLSGRYQLQLLGGRSPLSECATPTSLQLSAGCGSSLLQVQAECGAGNWSKSSYSCHAHWTDQGQSILVLQGEESGSTLCLNYADKLMSVSETGCGAAAPVYTIMETSPCLQALSSHPTSSAPGSRAILAPGSRAILLQLCSIFILSHLLS